jgi:hypothetical protein
MRTNEDERREEQRARKMSELVECDETQTGQKEKRPKELNERKGNRLKKDERKTKQIKHG